MISSAFPPQTFNHSFFFTSIPYLSFHIYIMSSFTQETISFANMCVRSAISVSSYSFIISSKPYHPLFFYCLRFPSLPFSPSSSLLPMHPIFLVISSSPSLLHSVSSSVKEGGRESQYRPAALPDTCQVSTTSPELKGFRILFRGNQVTPLYGCLGGVGHRNV